MKAPEKLYISHCKDYSEERIFVAYPEREFSEDIEYTRTDAFIEKAEEFLYKMLNDGRMECGDMQKFIDELRKYNED